MKVKYFAALAAASVFGLAGLTSCAGDTSTDTTDPAATEVTPDTTGDTMEKPADTMEKPAGDAMEEPATEPAK